MLGIETMSPVENMTAALALVVQLLGLQRAVMGLLWMKRVAGTLSQKSWPYR